MYYLIIKLCLYSFTNHFILSYPVYTIMFQEHGVSLSQIGLLLMIWSAAALIFEVPSGVIADRYPRKYILVVSKLLKALVFIIWLNHNFLSYLLGFVTWALAGSLHSGTYQALAYDELKKINKANHYEKVSGYFKTLSHIAVAISLALGGFVSKNGYNLTLILSSMACLLATIVAFSFPKTKPKKLRKKKNTQFYF